MSSQLNGVRGFLSVAQIAERWSCHPNTVRRQLRSAECVRVGRLVRYPMEEVERIEQNGWKGVQPAKPAKRDRARPESIPGVNKLRDRYGAW